ncbi:DsbA family protein [Achromobacter pestifer]|uniref:DsbA family protein n=1 Tax=Achromobacter pestifer TaxID=1353889 RepID=A0A7D4E070_9BURK|nr:DsbA family protein [Achromobacter pestifer]QKH38355.1 DsbA family protein [Achromobacter pestifer]
MMNCDSEQGACALPLSDDMPARRSGDAQLGWVVHYVGDPMCSWCWGMAPAIERIALFCQAEGVPFKLTVGGLRVGGGDPWDENFKRFLRHEWSHIAKVTGQPFGFDLLDRTYFNYDTEPPCRAVVVAERMASARGLPAMTKLAFFAAVQRKFYVEGQDPAQADYYREPCAHAGLPFGEFRDAFTSAFARHDVAQDFALSRRLGVRGFPSLLLEGPSQVTVLATGAMDVAAILARLRQAVPIGAVQA